MNATAAVDTTAFQAKNVRSARSMRLFCRSVAADRAPRQAESVTADDIRDLALEHDGTSEGAHHGHPDFRANNRIFASLRQHETLGMVKLSVPQQHEFLRQYTGMFVPSPGVWGRE